ncbi:MAG: HdeD family acid-resistance protein [Alphaproteobacteria bacterium]|nr:HdeD family acid-resistance protein [Alphaproteobacteria bacterium]MBV9373092.1 HdeD family acid-resistance protein [Alphaproteobacteria bacterium]MBV9902878.1 HdeD family acid-resistance protein [Alphaproteobacteria bacterium]
MATTFDRGNVHGRARQALLASNWWAAALRGVCAILLGSIAIFAPAVTLVALAMVFAAYSLVDGVFAIVLAIRGARRHERWGWLALNGIGSIAAAAIALFYPALTALAFGILFAAWALVSGVTSIVAALSLGDDHGRWWLLITGLIALIFGLWAMWDISVGMLALSYLVGFQALLAGFALLALAYRLRTRHAESGATAAPAAPFSGARTQEAHHG